MNQAEDKGETLRLAYELTKYCKVLGLKDCGAAADLLRAQQAEIERLRAEAKVGRAYIAQRRAEALYMRTTVYHPPELRAQAERAFRQAVEATNVAIAALAADAGQAAEGAKT